MTFACTIMMSAPTPPPLPVLSCQAKGAVIVESFALCFEAMSSLPGPYVNAFVQKVGAEGLAALLATLENKTAFAEHRVAFSAGPGEEPKVSPIFDCI